MWEITFNLFIYCRLNFTVYGKMFNINYDFKVRVTQRNSAIDVSAFSDKAGLVPFPWLRRNIATAQQTKATAACIHVLRQHHIRPPRPIIHYALFAAARSALVSLSKMLQPVVSLPP